jgi:hypothetical protein
MDSMDLHRQSAGLLGEDQPYHKDVTYTGQNNTEEKLTHIRASSGIRIHDSSVRAAQDISCLRLRSPMLLTPVNCVLWLGKHKCIINADIILWLRVMVRVAITATNRARLKLSRHIQAMQWRFLSPWWWRNSVHPDTAKFIARANQPTESLCRAVSAASPYFKGLVFKSRPGYRPFWLKFLAVLFSTSRQMPKYNLQLRYDCFLPHLLQFANHIIIRSHIV